MMYLYSWIIAVTTTLIACAGGSTPNTNQGRDSQSAGEGNAVAGDENDKPGKGKGISADDILGDDTSFLRAKYQVSLRTLGIDACKGEVIIRVKAKMSSGGADAAQLFEIKDGLVKCAGLGVFDVAEMLGSMQAQPVPSEVKQPVEVRDNVIGLKAMGSAVYEPARPMLPSFLAASPQELAALNVTRPVSMFDGNTQTTSNGVISIQTLGFGSWQPPNMARTFPKVLHFRTSTTGFNDADKISNMMADVLEFRISLDPIAILSIYFEGRASDYTNSLDKIDKEGKTSIGKLAKDNDGIKGAIKALGRFTKVKMQIDLIDQQNLDESDTTPVDDSEPIIGG